MSAVSPSEVIPMREAWLRQKADEIRSLERTAVESMLKTGGILIEVKKATTEGEWQRWLADNLDYSGTKARAMMRAYRRFRDDPDIRRMNISTVQYLCHADDEQVAAVKAMHRNGTAPTSREVKDVIWPKKEERDPDKEILAALDEEEDAKERLIKTVQRLKEDLRVARNELRDGVVLKFDTMTAAASALGVSKSAISMAASKRQRCKGALVIKGDG